MRTWSTAASGLIVALAIGGCTGSTATSAPASAAPDATPAPVEPSAVAAWPEPGSTIEVIVPFSAGGSTDLLARTVAPIIGAELGANVEVFNVPGAESQIGLTQLASSDPDGYTIGFTNIPSALASYISEERQATYNLDSFAPIGRFTLLNNFIAVHSSSEYQTVEQLIEAAKAKSVTVGVSGDNERVALGALGEATGVEFTLVPFDGGAEKTAALLGKQVDAIFGGGPTMVPGVESGDFRVLGVFGTEPDVYLPDVPTLGGLGLKSAFTDSIGMSAPAGTDPEIVAKISATFEKALADPKVQELAKSKFHMPAYLDGAAFGKLWAEQEAIFRAAQGQ